MKGGFEQNIKTAFSKVKEDISRIFSELDLLKMDIGTQKESIDEIKRSLKELKETLKGAKSTSSIGNEGADQSINQLINQSINQSPINHQELAINTFKEVYTDNKGNIEADQSINQSPINQSFNQSINQLVENNKLKEVTKDINKLFSSLSKQELKLFLTIYQLEDDGVGPNYKNLSLKMQLSEHCVRGHLSSLLRKSAPILKKRLNNRTTLLSVSNDFKALNLKQRLINLYYDSDPHQKTLVDL